MSPATSRSKQQWLDEARGLVLRGDFGHAEAVLDAALGEFPRSLELRRVAAGVLMQSGRNARAEALLSDLLREHPQDAGSAFALARLLIEQGRTRAAGQILRNCLEPNALDSELAIPAIEMLDEADRKADAAAIAEAAIATTPNDPRLHAYAGMLELQLGKFERARERYLFALSHSPQACEWHVPHGLAQAQRYTDVAQPDFRLFRECLQRNDLSDRARSTLLFALGKAHDDVGDYRQAAAHFREANVLAHALTQWSRKDWRRTVEARLASGPIAQYAEPVSGFVPVFIVGMPRSGTTVLAELLARHPGVCNRGELPWIANFAQQAELSGVPSPEALTRAAAFYAVHTRRDDAVGASWFIDKQPLNFRYVDLMLALFQNARVIHCMRNARDTALSIWTQSFLEEVQGYAYDFDDIAVVMRDCERLMAHWQRQYPHAICTIRYEELVAQPGKVMAELIEWLGLPEVAPSIEREASSISTASLWQARQPVYSGSVQRWRGYSPHVPELSRFADK